VAQSLVLHPCCGSSQLHSAVRNSPLAARTRAAIPIAVLFDGKIELKIQIKQQSIHLLRTVGTFTVLDYHEGLAEALKQQAQKS
jgi:hypothetical protein